MNKINLLFSKDFSKSMMVHTTEKTVRFMIDGKEVESDKWKVQSLIQILVDFDKEVK